ncbi:MAG TPA: hypothetical protein VEN81_13845 [Planctomycetota bacterium]|nr:hypothetical protein [Planctomycetota bacterium]
MASQTRSLQILLGETSYTPGENIRGTVELVLDRPLRTRGVRLYLSGSEVTEITIRRGMGRDERRVTYDSTRTILNEGLILFGEDRVGTLQAMKETLKSLAGSLDSPILPAGRHRYPFEFTLPNDALPTWSGPHARVAYTIWAVVDVPAGKDLRFDGTLYVIAPESWSIIPQRVSERHVPGGLLGFFQADVSMEFEFGGCALRWRERLEGKLRIRNRSRKAIRGATISLLAVEHAEANGYVRDSTRTVLSGFFRTPNPSADRHEVTFGFVLDPPLAPFQGASSRVVYWLQAEVDVKGAGNPVVQLPLELQ